MEKILKKMKLITFLLSFVVGAIILFSQNGMANVYADSYEDQYSQGTYTIEIGKTEKDTKNSAGYTPALQYTVITVKVTK